MGAKAGSPCAAAPAGPRSASSRRISGTGTGKRYIRVDNPERRPVPSIHGPHAQLLLLLLYHYRRGAPAVRCRQRAVAPDRTARRRAGRDPAGFFVFPPGATVCALPFKALMDRSAKPPPDAAG